MDFGSIPRPLIQGAVFLVIVAGYFFQGKLVNDKKSAPFEKRVGDFVDQPSLRKKMRNILLIQGVVVALFLSSAVVISNDSPLYYALIFGVLISLLMPAQSLFFKYQATRAAKK